MIYIHLCTFTYTRTIVIHRAVGQYIFTTTKVYSVACNPLSPMSYCIIAWIANQMNINTHFTRYLLHLEGSGISVLNQRLCRYMEHLTKLSHQHDSNCSRWRNCSRLFRLLYLNGQLHNNYIIRYKLLKILRAGD